MLPLTRFPIFAPPVILLKDLANACTFARDMLVASKKATGIYSK